MEFFFPIILRRQRMKDYLVIVSLLVLFVSPVVFAQEEDIDEGPSPMEELEIQTHMRNAELEMQEKEMQLQQQRITFEMRRQRQQIELAKQKLELQHQRRAFSEHAGQEEHHDEERDNWSEHEVGLAEHAGKAEHHDEGGGVILVIILIVNILLAVWVYTDIRKLNTGSGIWIIVVLLTGLLGVIPYAIVRLGNIQKPV
jgi:cation transport ATPase